MHNANFYTLMEEQIQKYSGKNIQKRDMAGEVELSCPKRLLLHCCCAPCSSHCLWMLSNYFDITAYFYNPNITDYEEYIKRYKELLRFTKQVYEDRIDVKLENHEPQVFYEMARGMENLPERGERCYKCYRLRLEKTAAYAKKEGYDLFTTTLSISPHKNATWINEIGQEMGEKYGVEFLFSDFKKKNGYKHSIDLSHEYNLYRQDYCGCEFSRRAREEAKQL